ncbi:MAG: HPr(Ser) kinase/phosphatase [Clostridia bacterium]|nr:HPr(Ser) kinase/phosphatase [Clostridia bacterium]
MTENNPEVYTVPLSAIIKEFSLETLYLPTLPESILISNKHVNRLGLPFIGFYKHFEHTRIELIGNAEHLYLEQLSEEERHDRLAELMRHQPACIILAQGLDSFPGTLELAEEYKVPVLRTKEVTSEFMAALISFLNVSLAPRLTRHGVLVNVYGEGVLLLGNSGIGKSETAIELVKRGHRLIADDAVLIKRVSSKTLVGEAPEIIRHYVELRGIGIVDVRRLFGMGAVSTTTKIDLVINLENWQQGKMYDRMGLDNETTEILGIQIPSITIPVCPGRNLAIILEIAAMNHRQKKMGYNTAEEFNKRLMEQMGVPTEE